MCFIIRQQSLEFLAWADLIICTALLLRIPPELKSQIEEAAKNNKRSINFEATRRLEQSFSDTEKTDLSSLLAEMRELRLGG